MFLPSSTVANIQKQFNAESFCNHTIKILDIHSQRGEHHVRFLMDEDECVVVMQTKVGEKIHIVLDDYVRWSAYYRMVEIRDGREVDEAVDGIVAIWPVEQQPLVVVDIKRPEPKVEPQVRPEKLDALQAKFGTRGVTRSHRK